MSPSAPDDILRDFAPISLLLSKLLWESSKHKAAGRFVPTLLQRVTVRPVRGDVGAATGE